MPKRTSLKNTPPALDWLYQVQAITKSGACLHVCYGSERECQRVVTSLEGKKTMWEDHEIPDYTSSVPSEHVPSRYAVFQVKEPVAPFVLLRDRQTFGQAWLKSRKHGYRGLIKLWDPED